MTPRHAMATLAAVTMLAATSTQAQFVDVGDIAALSDAQDHFDDLSADLGAAFSYHSLMPAGARETLSLPFALEVGAAAVGAPITSASDINDALDSTSGTDMDDLPDRVVLPSLRADASFPYDISAGLAFAQVPGTAVSYWGGELRWSAYDFPGPGVVGVRGTASTISGIDNLAFSTMGAEAIASANLGLGEPYAHAGLQRVTSDPDASGLDSFSAIHPKLGAGLRLDILPFVNVTGEVNRVGGRTTLGLRAAAGL